MSFLSDFFEGNWSNLGTDISHTFSSLAAHPDELAETIGGAALLGGAAFLAPEIGAAVGLGGAAEAGAAGADIGGAALGADVGAADLGAADAAFGAFDPAVFGANAADVAAGGVGAELAGGGLLADALPAAGELTAFAPESAFVSDTAGVFDAFAPGAADFGGAGGGDVFALGASDAGPAVDTGAEFGAGAQDLSGTAGGLTGTDASFSAPAASTAGGTVPAAGTTPAGFAPTDAELSGGITGTGGGTSGGGFWSNLTSGVGSTLNNPLFRLGAGLAPLALTLGMGEPKLPAAAGAANAQALQLQQAGLTDLANARAGVLNAGQTAVLGQMKQDLTNQWRQTLFNQGVKDVTKDTRWPQVEALIDSQVTQQTATMIQQNITNALQETGQASQALLSIANMQMQADTAFTNNLINATKSLGLVAGLSAAKVTIG